MDNDVVKVSDEGRFRVRLVGDEDCQTPRESDSLSHVVTVPTFRYQNVDKTGGPLADGWDRIKHRPDAMDLFERWARIFHGAVTLRDTPAGAGASAVWYVLPGEEYPNDPTAYLECEARAYRQWADGETYGWITEEIKFWTDGDGGTLATWEEVDSCWGLIGYDYARTAALEELAHLVKDKAKVDV